MFANAMSALAPHSFAEQSCPLPASVHSSPSAFPSYASLRNLYADDYLVPTQIL